MAETKYGKYIHTEDVLKAPEGDFAKYYSVLSHEGELDVDCSLGYHCITAPVLFDKPHAHEFAEILCFVGGDPTNIRDLGAEIEISLGEEQEKHVITSAAVVAIPGGLVHCPLNIKTVNKPFIFLEISLVPKYGPPVARSH